MKPCDEHRRRGSRNQHVTTHRPMVQQATGRGSARVGATQPRCATLEGMAVLPAPLLVARLHVDLQRVSSAVCSRG